MTLSSVTPNSAQGGLPPSVTERVRFTSGPVVIGKAGNLPGMVLRHTDPGDRPGERPLHAGDVPFRLLSDPYNYITDPVN